MVLNLVFFLFAFLFGGIGALIVFAVGGRMGLLDRPNHRSSHSITTPKGGGIGLVLAFLMCSVFLKMSLEFILPVGILAILSLWGDRTEIPPKIRLPAQFLLISALLITHFKKEIPDNPVSWLLCGLAIVFVVGTANFYNFMDGINGIAGITGVIGFGFLAISLHGVQPIFSSLSLAMSLACAGFLPFNFPQARVFMGDVGSVTLGAVFAILVVIGSGGLLDFIVRASFIFPFFADELSTMWIRIRQGEDLTQAHRQHVYQVLANEWGFSHWRVSIGYGIFQIAVAVSVIGMAKIGYLSVLLVLVIWFVVFLFFSKRIRKKKKTECL